MYLEKMGITRSYGSFKINIAYIHLLSNHDWIPSTSTTKLSSRDSIVLLAFDMADGISWESETSTANSMDATTSFGGVFEMTTRESVDNDSSTVELFTQNEK